MIPLAPDPFLRPCQKKKKKKETVTIDWEANRNKSYKRFQWDIIYLSLSLSPTIFESSTLFLDLERVLPPFY